jgi:DNA-binding transcriptional LysR family regulator
MTHPLKTRIATWWLLRRTPELNPQVLGSQGRTPQTWLVLLPGDKGVARVARHFIRQSGWSERPHVHFISNPEGVEHYSFLASRLSTWKEADLNWWGVLPKEVVQELVPENVEAIINLDPHSPPEWMYLVHHHSAWLKIGFDFPGARHLYNVVLSTRNRTFVERGYLTINQLLKSSMA